MKYKAKLTDKGTVKVVPDIYTHCLRCNRVLKSEEARNRGFGKICWEKVKDANKNVLF